MKVTRAVVYANRRKPQAAALRREVERFLRLRGVSLSARRPQLIITIGGDGTVLYRKKHYGTPFFAIGSQTSFICQATFANWRGKLSRALSSLCTERRLMLECSIGGRRMPLALNDIGVRTPEPRVLSLHLEAANAKAGGRARSRHYAFRADGILFCTPTGSPAYCYSCGGRQMKRNDAHWQAVAISPFRRIFKPLTLSRGARCTLRMSEPERAQFFIDGHCFRLFSAKHTLRVWASKRAFLFAKAQAQGFGKKKTEKRTATPPSS
jgi:NAD+ kinase